MSRRAVITGVTGQDGSYLAELLLEKGYEVVGATRRLSAPNLERIEHLRGRIELRQADLLDPVSLLDLVDEIYLLDHGELVWNGTPAEFEERQEVLETYLGADL